MMHPIRLLLLLLTTWIVAGAAVAQEPLASVQPFGSNLFSGAFSAERHDGLSADYRIVPGDRITIRLWGAVAVDETATVDAQGNVFIPDVGPVQVAGVRNSELNQVIGARVRATYVENVEVYTNLHGSQPVAVFVTGRVIAPGMYAGVATDSVLYYLDRARGIDPERGSYRRVSLIRAGRTLQTFDLYRFLLDGQLPPAQLRDGDTILVGPRGPSIAVEGLIRTPARYEFGAEPVTGRELLELAQPQVDASHATVEGDRAEGPFSLYVSLEEFQNVALREGDRVRLERGRPAETLLVRIEGEHLGPSAMAVPIGASLMEVLDRVEVDPRLANIGAIHLRRASIARRQREALEESLDRLEASVLGARSQSTGEVEIRVREAELVAKFVERARQILPEGRLIVSQGGKIADVRLEPEDVIVVPPVTDVILVHGEVNFPRAIVHRPGSRTDDYVEQAGGYTERADRKRVVLRRANGEIEIGQGLPVGPGDEVNVLPEVDVKEMQIAKDMLQVIYQLAISTSVALAL